jgi:type IV secretion system protein VirB11
MLAGHDAANELATRLLRPLAEFYARPDVEEIVVNQPAEVWLKTRAGAWSNHPAPELTYDYLVHRVCRVLANINRARFDESEVPIVSAELPGLPFRFQAVAGNNVRYNANDRRGVCIAIRSLQSNVSIGMDSFVPPGLDLPGLQHLLEEMDASIDHIDRIRTAVERGMSILVSGVTSSGKTTFTNQLIRQIDRDARVITVEDVIELDIPHANRVRLTVPRNRGTNAIGYPEILDALVRLTPDFIVCGEVSVANAGAIYSLMGKGHPVISTVHAGTPEEALMAVVNNMSTGGSSHDTGAALATLRQLVGCVVQLERRQIDGRTQRRVVDIAFPAMDAARRSVAGAHRPEA